MSNNLGPILILKSLDSQGNIDIGSFVAHIGFPFGSGNCSEVAMAYRATAIANEFLAIPGAAQSLTQMQLQKLTYIAHGWNWAINHAPLVSDTAEAWAYGPVYRDLYDHTKFFGKAPIGRLITPDDDNMVRFFLRGKERNTAPYKADVTPAEREVIHHVWNRYGRLDGSRLSALTHQKGTPWFVTYTTKGKNYPIDNALIKNHYDELARRATERAAAVA